MMKKKEDYTDYKRGLHRLQFIALVLFLLILQTTGYCFTVSPNRIEIKVAPSKSYEGILTVKNTDKTTMSIKLRVEDWFKATEGKGKEMPFQPQWLNISPLEFEIKEGRVKEATYKVNIPKNAKGEFNAMIFIDGKAKKVKEGAIAINTSIGVPIYAMVAGTERYRAEVEDLKVVKSAPLELEVKIKNTGNVHIRPQGEIVIKGKIRDKKGKEGNMDLVKVPLNEYNYPILPNSSRTLEIGSSNRLESGDYTADIKMGFADKKYRKKITLKVQ